MWIAVMTSDRNFEKTISRRAVLGGLLGTLMLPDDGTIPERDQPNVMVFGLIAVPVPLTFKRLPVGMDASSGDSIIGPAARPKLAARIVSRCCSGVRVET